MTTALIFLCLIVTCLGANLAMTGTTRTHSRRRCVSQVVAGLATTTACFLALGNLVP